MTLYLLQFNNYFNRQIKKRDTLEEYADYVVETIADVNFKPNDGYQTSQIVNLADLPTADYVVVANGTEIVSRWFIMECSRLRGNQYKMDLQRDIMVDYYGAIVSSPCFIEKGNVNYNNNLIFNSENMTFNQIKTKEVLLNDKSGTPWIVGYYAQPKDADGNEVSASGKVVVNPRIDYYMSGINSTDWQYNTTEQIISNEKAFINYSFGVVINSSVSDYLKFKFNVYGNLGSSRSGNTNGYSISIFDSNALKTKDYYKWYKYADLESTARTLLKCAPTDDLLKYKDKIISFKDGVYKCIITESDYEGEEFITNANETAFNSMRTSTVKGLASIGIINPTVSGNQNEVFKCYVVSKAYKVVLEKIANVGATYNWEIPVASNKLNDQPYKMFMAPLNSVKVTGTDLLFTTGNDVSMQIGTDIARVLGSGCYDLQLLPYCAITSLLSDEKGHLVINDDMRVNVDYSFIVYEHDNIKEVVGCLFFPKVSSFNNRIVLDEPVVITEPKIQSECDMYRLCSPNYSGAFEFNAAKNGGINAFDVDCTYLPHNPYIHLAPDFGRLYGRDFDDSRGLICGGNFSLAIISDAWTNYQIQNKNYNEIFQAKIENMEYKKNLALTSDIISAVTGTIGGVAAGGMTYGVGGAVVGGLASAGGGIADVVINEQTRARDLQLTKDLYGYELGNIKALPNGLSKTTAYNINNKYFPFLEYYTCSEEEKQALRDKIKYNGMTIMTIGKIKDYVRDDEEVYIKGQIIRLEGIHEDSNIAHAIYGEVNKGIYIGG